MERGRLIYKLISCLMAVIRGKRVKIKYRPATKGATIKYKTSNRKVFTVNKKGILKGKTMGAATLQVSVRSAGKTRKQKVKVFVVNALRPKLKKYVHKFGTHMESWYPLGGRGNTKELLGNSTIMGISEKRDITPAQAIIRWHIQDGYIVIPGSSDPDHIKENIETLEKKLTWGDMRKFRKLNKNERFENW